MFGEIPAALLELPKDDLRLAVAKKYNEILISGGIEIRLRVRGDGETRGITETSRSKVLVI